MGDIAKATEASRASAPSTRATATTRELTRATTLSDGLGTPASELGTIPTTLAATDEPIEALENGTLLVEAEPGASQWTKRAFLDHMRREIKEAAEQELSGTGWTVEHCPYFDYWFSYYERRSAADVEAAIRKYAPESTGAMAAANYIEPLVSRIRQAVARWRTSGEIDSPPASIPREVVMQAALGPGRPLESATRTRMEQAMETRLDGIRLHDDSVATRVVSSQHARALAVGPHIAFASGEYRPGTLVGDAILAHELAHTQQQGTTPSAGGPPEATLEGAADRQALGVLARLRLGITKLISPGARVQQAGLRLQRCKVNTNEVKVPDQPADAVAAVIGAVPAASTLDLSSIPNVDISKHKQAAADSLLFITGTRQGASDRELFILPATGFVLEAAPVDQVKQPDPARTTVLTMPAAGHAGVHLINTGDGAGILLDVAGTPNDKGTPDVLLSRNLVRLQAELGIARVDGAFISHAHGDHAGALEWMVKNGNLTGNRVWLMPGLEDFTKGPLGRELTKLGTGTISSKFPAGWKATPLDARQVANTNVTTATLEAGDATLTMAVGTRALQRFVSAEKTRDWRAASALADAATPLTHVSWKGTSVEAIVVGDLRGMTIRDLVDNMGEVEFAKFVGNASVLIGLHHLGAIGSASDVEGLQKLLRAMGGGKRPITVLAQVGPEFPVYERLVKALQISGARVITIDKPDPNNPNANVKVHSTGEVEEQGGTVADIDATTKAAQDRLQTLERAQRTIEALPEFRGIPGASKREVLDGLAKEAARLGRLLEQRQMLATSELHRSQQSAKNVADIEATATSLKSVEGMEKRADFILFELALSPEELDALVKENAKAEAEGTTSQALRELLARVDPQLAREILMDATTGEPESREAAEEMWERVAARLGDQADIQAMMQATTFNASAKGAAWIGLALQAFDLAKPALDQWAKSRDNAEHEDFYMFYRDLFWWNEKGIRLPAKWSPGVADQHDVLNGVARRLYDDAPDGQRGGLSPDLAKTQPLKQLWVPQLGAWGEGERAAFFDALRLWLDLHVRSIDDYYRDLKTGIDAPIRPETKTNPFWQLHVGVVEGGHVHGAWQTSEALTTIMDATMNRADTGTQSQIDKQLKSMNARPIPSHDTGPAASVSHASAAHGDPVRELAVTKRAGIYTEVNGRARSLDHAAYAKDGFRFLELSGAAPSDYIWVAPGDSRTAFSLGALIGMQYRRQIEIPAAPRDINPNDPDFKGYGHLPPERYMNAEQLAAWRAVEANVDGYCFHKTGADGKGTISIYGTGPMRGGVVLMRRKDLGPAP